jgi:NAD(P)-dependent dehydrogenase (short-subunit alcohol dehydrogenase family)
MKLKNKVAIVTGGGAGIGKAISLALSNEGAAVVVAARNPARLEEMVKEIKSGGGKAKAIQTDISDHEQVKRMVAQTIDEFGQIDILVNNAASAPNNKADVADMNLDNWYNTLSANLTGTMLCSREVLKAMIPRRSGSIINISSVAGASGHPTESPYCVSKWGIVGLTEVLAIEAGKHNIRVNCLSPAATRTEGFTEFVRGLGENLGISGEEMMAKIADKNSLKRIAEPSEIAACVVFLASDDSSAVTGHNLMATCGFHLTQPEEIS